LRDLLSGLRDLLSGLRDLVLACATSCPGCATSCSPARPPVRHTPSRTACREHKVAQPDDGRRRTHDARRRRSPLRRRPASDHPPTRR